MVVLELELELERYSTLAAVGWDESEGRRECGVAWSGCLKGRGGISFCSSWSRGGKFRGRLRL